VTYSPSTSSRTVPQPTVPALLSAKTSRLKQFTWLATEQSRSQPSGLIRFGAFCRNESTAARSVTSTIWKNDWLKSGVVLTFDQNIIDRAVNQWRDRLHKMCTRMGGGHFKHQIWTFWLFWLTSTALETHDMWVMLFKIHISVKSRRISMKLRSTVCNGCWLVCVKFYLNRISFAVVIAKCLGGSLFWDTL